MARCADCTDFLDFGEVVNGAVGVCDNPMNYDGDRPPEVSVRAAMDGCVLYQPKVTKTITCPVCGASISVGVSVTGAEVRP